MIALANGMVARLLRAKIAPSGVAIETYALAPIGNPGGSVAQLELFRALDGSWCLWTGPAWRWRQYGNELARKRNEVAL